MDYSETAKKIIKNLGGDENITGMTHCVTRLRVDVQNIESVDESELKVIPEVGAVVLDGNNVQIMLGPGTVSRVYEEAMEMVDLDSEEKEDAQQLKEAYAKKNATPGKLFIKKISSIFIPILPAIIACGLVKGINNILANVIQSYATTSTSLLLTAIGNATFTALSIFVGISAAKVFKGSPYLGGALASLMSLPELANIHLFGQALVPGRGGIISVLLIVIISCSAEKKLHKVMPNALDTFLTPLVIILVGGALALIVIQPIGGLLSDGIVKFVNFALDKGGIFGGFVFGVAWLPLVMTGLHHSILPVHAQLIEKIGYTPLMPIFAMVGPGQLGAVLCVYLKTKNKRLRSIIIGGTPIQLMGIGEPLLYGVTLPLVKPFIAACISAGVGGALCVIFSIHSMGMGLSGLPLALMLNSPIKYILIMLVTIGVSFILTNVLGFDDDVIPD
jgi:PTS system sucrose-specific IIC component